MKFTIKTEYGVLCMIHLAKHPAGEWVTIREMSATENYPGAFLEKILQKLKKAGLVESHQGNQGGYTLARRPSEITLRQVIEALEGGTFDVFCKPENQDMICTHFCLCGVKPVWRKTKQLLDDFYGSVTLEMLTKNEMEVVHSLAPSAKVA